MTCRSKDTNLACLPIGDIQKGQFNNIYAASTTFSLPESIFFHFASDFLIQSPFLHIGIMQSEAQRDFIELYGFLKKRCGLRW